MNEHQIVSLISLTGFLILFVAGFRTSVPDMVVALCHIASALVLT